MDKVNETYLSEKNSNKISEFIHILQDFDQANGKASELYHVSHILHAKFKFPITLYSFVF